MPKQDTQFVEKAVTDLMTEAARPLSLSVGQSISDVYYGLIGSRTQTYASNRMAAEMMKREDFIKNLVIKAENIDEVDLKEPEMHIIGPAIEATTFYMENETLKKMFEKLILSSMQISKAEFVHPAFVEIIKQLSSIDANIIAMIGINSFPVVEYRLANSTNNNYLTQETNVFLDTEIAYENSNLVQSSITNLERLGLISIDYVAKLLHEERYNKFLEHDLYFEVEKQLQQWNNSHPEVEFDKVVIEKGSLEITPLGRSFTNSCI